MKSEKAQVNITIDNPDSELKIFNSFINEIRNTFKDISYEELGHIVMAIYYRESFVNTREADYIFIYDNKEAGED